MSTSEIQQLLSTPWAILLAAFFLCASIFVHELGHFLAARWRGLVVDRFSIGFGPRVFGWRRKGVDYRISLIPLGGYVALPQLADMRAIEGESEHADLPPISYLDKVIVSAAGAFFNILFALFLGAIVWFVGMPVPESAKTTTVGYVAKEIISSSGERVPGPAYVAGLQPGDEILTIDGDAIEEWTDVIQRVATGGGQTFTGERATRIGVERNGQEVDITVHPILSSEERLRAIGILPRQQTVIGSIFEQSPAQTAGLQAGDKVVSIDGEQVMHPVTLSTRINQAPEAEHTLGVLRNGQEMQVKLKAEMATIGNEQVPMIGVRWAPEPTVDDHPNPFSQVARAVNVTLDVLGAWINPKSDVGVRNLSGPVGIAHALFISVQEGIAFLLFLIVLINVNLAIVNLLPIPVLDGGHIAFATIEKLRGKPLPPNLMAASQSAFMLILLALFAYITWNDVSRVGSTEAAREAQEQAQALPDPVFTSAGANAPAPAADGQPELRAAQEPAPTKTE